MVTVNVEPAGSSTGRTAFQCAGRLREIGCDIRRACDGRRMATYEFYERLKEAAAGSLARAKRPWSPEPDRYSGVRARGERSALASATTPLPSIRPNEIFRWG